MNRKGFTLVEVLAVIVILGVILTITSPYIMTAYKNSKLKSEEVFVNRLSTVIDSYVKLNSYDITFSSSGTATKEGQGTVNIEKGTITIQDIINDNLLSQEKYVNAGNKEISCNKNAQIEVYKDSDFVYCYKVRKDSLGCLTNEYKNSIDNTYAIDTCIWSR